MEEFGDGNETAEKRKARCSGPHLLTSVGFNSPLYSLPIHATFVLKLTQEQVRREGGEGERERKEEGGERERERNGRRERERERNGKRKDREREMERSGERGRESTTDCPV